MKRRTEDALIELGVTPNLKGFEYICKAVEILQKNGRNMKIVDGLYFEIAKKCGTGKTNVERAIRHSTSKMDKGSDAWAKYIGIKEKTNSAVLFTLSMRLEEDGVDE